MTKEVEQGNYGTDKWQRPVIQFRQALYSCNVSSLAPRILSILRVVRTQWKPTLPSGIQKYSEIRRQERSKLPSKSDIARYIYIEAKQLRQQYSSGRIGRTWPYSTIVRCLLLETIITTWQTQIVQRPHALASKLYYIYIYMIVQLRLCSHVYDRRREETQLA